MKNYYEIIFLIHPDKGDQIPNLIEKISMTINEYMGKVHYLENWGKRQLAYSISKVYKAYYILMNIEISKKNINQLKINFYFDKNIIRSLILRIKNILIEESPMMKLKK